MTTISTERTFDASPEIVFAALRDAARLEQWWGPEGFRNRFEVFEFRPGGEWRFIMQAPNGMTFPNHSRFEEVVANERVCIRHLNAPQFLLTITLEAEGMATHVTWVQEFLDAEVGEKMRSIVEPAQEQNLDRWQRNLVAQS